MRNVLLTTVSQHALIVMLSFHANEFAKSTRHKDYKKRNKKLQDARYAAIFRDRPYKTLFA